MNWIDWVYLFGMCWSLFGAAYQKIIRKDTAEAIYSMMTAILLAVLYK